MSYAPKKDARTNQLQAAAIALMAWLPGSLIFRCGNGVAAAQLWEAAVDRRALCKVNGASLRHVKALCSCDLSVYGASCVSALQKLLCSMTIQAARWP